MPLEVGVSAGFVIDSPGDDPDDSSSNVDGVVLACRHTSPAGANKITELGWWQDWAINSPGEYNMGVYADDGDAPGALITPQSSGQITTDSTLAWFKYAGLDIEITPNTVYWLALGMEVLSFPDNVNRTCLAGNPEATGLKYHWGGTPDGVLPDPFVSSGSNENISWTIYAKYEAQPFVPQAYMIMKGM